MAPLAKVSSVAPWPSLTLLIKGGRTHTALSELLRPLLSFDNSWHYFPYLRRRYRLLGCLLLPTAAPVSATDHFFLVLSQSASSAEGYSPSLPAVALNC
ncbi:hypothetical protein B296_00016780 [Ensete ventricosum]|uniref:Uncharacterized protein n=1 Tax=Ensete ventricosum TaxID=4639 RepID=A0A426ZBE7_ENSVE|nr:hypothetical protein B296_00016780 [Ensete ventricosum]